MPPHRWLLSWPRGRMSPRRCSPSWWAGSCMGTTVESWQTWAWLRPRGCLRQESCRGPGKGLAVVSWSSPARVLPGVSWVSLARISSRIVVFWLSSSLVFFWSLQGSACHHGGASRASVPKWLMVLELLGSRVAALLVLRKLPRKGSYRGCGGHPG